MKENRNNEKRVFSFTPKRRQTLIIAFAFNVLCFLITIFLFFKKTRLLFALLPLFLLFLLDAILCLHLFSLKQKEKKKEVEELFLSFSLLAIYLKADFPFIEALTKLVPSFGEALGEKLRTLIDKIETDKTVQPFLFFAESFPLDAVKDISLSLYLVYENPHKKEQLERFSSLVSENKKLFEMEEEKEKFAHLSFFQLFPLLATAIVLLLIFARVGNLIGELFHG